MMMSRSGEPPPLIDYVLTTAILVVTVAIAMYLAVLTGIGLLLLHAILRGLPRGGVARRLQPAHLRATLGWAWLAAATVFLLRPPREPYME